MIMTNCGVVKGLSNGSHTLQVDMYRDMWERAMDEGLEMLLQVNTEGVYFLGSAQVTKFGLTAKLSPQVNIPFPVAP